MSGAPHQTDAHLLARAPHAGDHLVLTCFSAADGVFTALLRAARAPRSGPAPAPDLFDRLSLSLEHGRGTPGAGPWFVKEHRLLVRHAAIGADYDRLAGASRLARLVAKNPVPEESRPAVDALLGEAFAAFVRPEARPDLVYFKSLYRLARDEGLPLKQDWIPALPAGDQRLVADALRLPSGSPESPAATDLSRLTRRLEAYLAGEHDLRFD